MKSIRAFFYLVRCGLWDTTFPVPEYFPLSDNEWRDVYHVAKQQTVRGIVFHGISLLPDGLLPSDAELVRWAACADDLERRNRHTNRVLLHLSGQFRSMGLHPIVLKGQGMASMYAQPLWRECGDIDLYFPSKTEADRAFSLLKRAGIRTESHADGSISYCIGGVTVEHHATLCDLHGTSVTHLIHDMEQRHDFQEIDLLTQAEEVKGETKDGKSSVLIPSPQLNWIVLNSHILKHCLGRGIGLRQVCDMARFCALHPLHAHAEELLQVCRLSGITRWTQMLQCCMVDYLAMPQESVVLPLGHTDASHLMDIILQGGNFGQHHHSMQPIHSTWHRKVQTAMCFLHNMGFSLRYAPRQAAYTFIQLLQGQKS